MDNVKTKNRTLIYTNIKPLREPHLPTLPIYHLSPKKFPPFVPNKKKKRSQKAVYLVQNVMERLRTSQLHSRKSHLFLRDVWWEGEGGGGVLASLTGNKV